MASFLLLSCALIGFVTGKADFVTVLQSSTPNAEAAVDGSESTCFGVNNTENYYWRGTLKNVANVESVALLTAGSGRFEVFLQTGTKQFSCGSKELEPREWTTFECPENNGTSVVHVKSWTRMLHRMQLCEVKVNMRYQQGNLVFQSLEHSPESLLDAKAASDSNENTCSSTGIELLPYWRGTMATERKVDAVKLHLPSGSAILEVFAIKSNKSQVSCGRMQVQHQAESSVPDSKTWKTFYCDSSSSKVDVIHVKKWTRTPDRLQLCEVTVLTKNSSTNYIIIGTVVSGGLLLLVGGIVCIWKLRFRIKKQNHLKIGMRTGSQFHKEFSASKEYSPPPEEHVYSVIDYSEILGPVPLPKKKFVKSHNF